MLKSEQSVELDKALYTSGVKLFTSDNETYHRK